ncbi:aminopeptidase N-like [Drosophila montana]|uniref:aminopeptidase N-like n=1 Tax=Drosophila montana TaxID=40370 RepID=UPI00313AFC57
MEPSECQYPGEGVRWIHQLRKEELVAIAHEFGLDKEGRVGELRKRLSTFAQDGGHTSEISARLAELESQYAKTLEPPSWGVSPDVGERPLQESEPDLRSSQLAKLLHDAWNLAYAGDLGFATAFNMTLFMKFERNHIIWNPVFTFIDQIGRRIDMSEVHKKFEEYVLTLLTPLYEELGAEIETEDNWKKDLRSLTKRFLCRSGFPPCIKEAKNALKVWQNTDNPNLQNPVANLYICPAFRWGSIDEWQFGLERVIQFPKTRIQSERTYLLKTLAGCSTQPEKIYRLLELSIFEEHSNFTENDQFLIFSSLTGSSSGYYTLFNFLSDYWTPIRQKYGRLYNTLMWFHYIHTLMR